MSERVIAGVRVPLVGDDERMHRAINRSIDDLRKLKGEIAATGTATDKQSRQVAILEEKISGMLATQGKANSMIGGGTSVLGKMREKVSATAGALAGMSSSFGTAGGQIGKFGSIATQAFGALAVGGPVALGLAAVGAGVSYVVDEMEKKKTAMEAAQKAATAHGESMRTLDAQIRAVGKSSKEAARIMAEAAAVNATTQYLNSDESKANIARSIAIEDELASAKKRKTGLHEILTLQAEQETLDNERKTAIGRINELYEKQVALAKAISIHEYSVAHAKERTAAATLKAYTDNVKLLGQGLGGFGPGSMSMGMATSLLVPDEVTRSWYSLLDAMEAIAKMAREVDEAGSFKTLAVDPAYTADDYMVDPSGWTPAESKKGGEFFGKGAVMAFVGGGGVSSVVASVAGPMAGQILGSITGILEKVSDAIVGIATKIAEAAGKGLDFILGSSKFGGLGSTGAGVLASGAGVLAPAAMGVGATTVAMAPTLALAGPAGAAVAGAAAAPIAAGAAGFGAAAGGAMLADMLMRATLETKSYAKAMAAMNGIFHSAVQMMEPVFDSLLPSIGLVGMLFRNLAQTLAPMNAAIGEAMGDALFNTFKAVAMTGIKVALQFDGLHILMMKSANALNFFVYGLQMATGQFDSASSTLQLYNDGVTALDAQQSRQTELMALYTEVAAMMKQDGMTMAEAFASIGEGADSLVDDFGALSSSMRNIPDFFNVARARRDSGATSTAPGSDIGAAGEFGATTGPAHGGFSVTDGGLYVNTLVVQAESPQQLTQRLQQRAYQSGASPMSSGFAVQVNGYRNGDF